MMWSLSAGTVEVSVPPSAAMTVACSAAVRPTVILTIRDAVGAGSAAITIGAEQIPMRNTAVKTASIFLKLGAYFDDLMLCSPLSFTSVNVPYNQINRHR